MNCWESTWDFQVENVLLPKLGLTKDNALEVFVVTKKLQSCKFIFVLHLSIMSFVHYNSAMDFSRGQNTPLHSSPKNATCPTPPWPTPPSNLDGSYSEILPNNLPNRNGLKRMSSFYPGIYIFSLALLILTFLFNLQSRCILINTFATETHLKMLIMKATTWQLSEITTANLFNFKKVVQVFPNMIFRTRKTALHLLIWWIIQRKLEFSVSLTIFEWRTLPTPKPVYLRWAIAIFTTWKNMNSRQVTLRNKKDQSYFILLLCPIRFTAVF